MIALDKFSEKDFDRLISWIENEEDLIQFAGPIFQYPLSRLQLSSYLQQSKKVPLRVRLVNTGEIIGHCEINFENEIPRLSRILIGEKKMRNQGYGKMVVREMIKITFTETKSLAIDLNVFDWNLNAIACYQKMGFTTQPEKKSSMTVGKEFWTAQNMILMREHFVQDSYDGSSK
ncbi:MAG: N-acetyltransferase [Pedobacter sp.]|nr:MAG: N-acetyltransferase [Pedobacter sp.]